MLMWVWALCLVLAIIIFIAGIAAGIAYYKDNRGKLREVSLVTIFLAVTFAAIFIMIIPLCWGNFVGSGTAGAQTFFDAIRASMQVFSLDGEYLDMYEATVELPNALRGWYRVVAIFLYVLAPVLLVSVIVTFFQNAFEHLRLRVTLKKHIFVFSELNAQSMLLAKSCRAKYSHSLLVFTDVYSQRNEYDTELEAQARECGALCFKDDVTTLFSYFRKKKSEVTLFIMGSDESENIRHTIKLMENCASCEKISLYVLTGSEVDEIILTSAMNENMKMTVRCINFARVLIYSHLYDNLNQTEKTPLVSRWKKDNASGREILSIVIVGLGGYGTELLRAWVWYGQIPGVELQIHVFEKDPLAEEKFSSLCQELMEKNHEKIDELCQYDIFFHKLSSGEGFDAETVSFDREIAGINPISVIYVTLGDDVKNLNIAIKLRRLFAEPESDDNGPEIWAMVTDPERNRLADPKCFKDYSGNQYNINLFGNAEDAWSYDVVVNDGLEDDALKRHLNWVKRDTKDYDDKIKENERNFYKYEYYRNSSMSAVIRIEVRNKINMLLPHDKFESSDGGDQEESDNIRRAEHIGWCAYMRSEGYRYAEKRNDLAKCHHRLKPFSELDSDEREKNDL